ncbi:MAG: hypothetical protein IJW90_01390, partial [Clostridia bacterium]|nr:hypothetical protein [Clostridia bacterium]
DGSYTVKNYIEWVLAELFAGNDVTLEQDIVITDYDLVHAHKWPSNGNGKYTEAHGNGAVFHIIKPGVVLDLNGHSITWDAHDDYYCNKRQVSLFMVTITGNPGETADLTIIDSSAAKTGKVEVYGMGTGLYVVGVDAKGTISGGTWTNYPCKTCGASNIFIYPSHGGTLEITGGTFEQKGSDCLIGWNGSSKPTTNNGVGVDQDATKVYITGGIFVGFNPETDVKFIDTANGSAVSEINGCKLGFVSEKDADGNYGVKPWNYEIHDKNDLVMFAEMANAGNNFSGKTITLMADINLGGMTWTPLSKFAGKFYGNNHVISNFHIDATSGHGGFFNVLEWATVEDLTLEKVTATVGAYRFGTLARSINQTNIDNVTVKNVKVTTTDSSAFVAGLFCHGTVNSNMEVNNCTVEDLAVNAEKGAYLIAGITTFVQKNGTEAEGTNILENLHVKNFTVVINDTDGVAAVGGLVGQTQSVWQNPRFNNCSVSGLNVTASGAVDVGGFICYPGSWTYAENCSVEGKIDVTGVTSASNFAGGFFGNYGWGDNVSKGDHKVTSCIADVDIITKVATAGGFVGSGTNSENRNKNITLTDCEAKGTVTCVEGGTATIGGFAGNADRGIYKNCSAAQDPFIGHVYAGSKLVNEGSYVASVNDVYFANLANAFAAATGADDEIIKLLADVELTQTIEINSDIDLMFDLNGHKLIGPDDGKANWYAFIIRSGGMTLVDSVGGGELFAKCYGIETTGGDFTLVDAKITATQNATLGTPIVNYGGYVQILGGELSGSLASVYTGGYFADAKTHIQNGATLNGPVVIENYDDKTFDQTVTSESNTYPTEEDYEWVLSDTVYHLEETKRVAQIGDVTYRTLADAINAAQNGDVIILLENIELTDEVLTISRAAKFSIDLNGKTITGTVTKSTTALVYVTGGCELTLLDSSADETGGIHAVNTNGLLSNLIRVEDDSKMVIESGNYTQDASVNGAGMIDSRGDEIITVKGGNFRLYNIGSASNGSPWIFNASSQNENNIIVQGGTFNADIIHQYYPFEVAAPKEKALKNNGDGTWTIVDAVAYVNEQHYSGGWWTNEVGYATIEEALEAAMKYVDNATKANEISTVTLLTNVTLKESMTIDKNIKVIKGDYAFNVAEGVTLTISAGTYDWDVNKYCVETHYAKKDGEKAWTVVEKFTIDFSRVAAGNSLRLDFAFQQAHQDDWTGYYAVFTRVYADGRTENVVTAMVDLEQFETIKGQKYPYVSYAGIAAKEMMDDVTVVIYNADGVAVSMPKTDSVQKYAMRTFDSTKNDEMKVVLVDMLNYGAAAQDYFNYCTDELANAGLTADHQAYATSSVSGTNNRVTDNTGYFGGSSVLSKSNIQVVIGFNKAKLDADFGGIEGMTAVLTYVNHYGISKTVTVEAKDFYLSGDFYAMNFDTLSIADARLMYTVTLYNAGGQVITTVQDSLEGYISRAMDKPNAHDVYEALLKFADSAYKYFH